MIAISSIDMYNILREKVGEKEAKALTEYIEVKVEQSFEKGKETLLTKEEFTKEMARIEVKISDFKAEIIKWMFIFWIGQVAVTLAMVFFRR